MYIYIYITCLKNGYGVSTEVERLIFNQMIMDGVLGRGMGAGRRKGGDGDGGGCIAPLAHLSESLNGSLGLKNRETHCFGKFGFRYFGTSGLQDFRI